METSTKVWIGFGIMVLGGAILLVVKAAEAFQAATLPTIGG